MSRIVTAATLAGIHAQDTEEIWLALLTISHESINPPIRVVANNENITLNGDEFIAFPFSIHLPDDTVERPSSMTLSIDNVDRAIVTAIRSVASSPTAVVQVIRYDELGNHDIELTLPEFKLKNADYDKEKVSGILSLESFWNEPWPSGGFFPSAWPGVF